MGRLRVGVLISGRGSNLQALIDAAQAPRFPAEIVFVLSNRPGVQGLDRAERAGIPNQAIDHRGFPDRAGFEAAMTAALEEAGVELVCQAGFMRILTAATVRHWQGRMINIHPALLPAFPGLDTHARALAAGVRVHGCTVHFVSEEVDAGPIIGQAAVAVLPSDSADDLAARVLAAEHLLYPHCLSLLAEGRITLQGDRAIIEDGEVSGRCLINPAPLATEDESR